MKVRDTAMGKWIEGLTEVERYQYIAHSLYHNSGSDNIFWQVVTKYNLHAANPIKLGEKVYGKLMDFDLDEVNRGEEE